jgi:NADPH:quinone reductase-like Zn-dependent oxidoreductase
VRDRAGARSLAAREFGYGPPEVVELREVNVPTPSDGQVLVRVRAASVNRANLAVDEGNECPQSPCALTADELRERAFDRSHTP